MNILLLKDVFTKRTTEIVKDFLTTDKEYQISYEKYLDTSQRILDAFSNQMKNVANKCLQTRVLLENVQCELKLALISKCFEDMSIEEVCDDAEKLLKDLKVAIIENETRRQEIKDMIESILKEKERVDKNVFNHIRRLMNRTIPTHFLGLQIKASKCRQGQKDELLSALLDYLLRHMSNLHQHCEKLDSFLSTGIKGLINYIGATKENIDYCFLNSTSLENLSHATILNGITLRSCLLLVELKARGISKITLDFEKNQSLN